MNDPPKELWLRWRGRQTGPFTIADLEQQLDAHEIGLGHQVYFEEHWITLEELFQQVKPPPPPSAPPQPGPSPAPAAESKPLSSLHLAAPSSPRPAGFPESSERSETPFSRQVFVTSPSTATGGTVFLPPATTFEAIPKPRPLPRLRLVYAGLGMFMGFEGAHNFYAGYWGRGLVQGLLTLTVIVKPYYGLIAAWAWALIEVIVVTHDAQGIPLRLPGDPV